MSGKIKYVKWLEEGAAPENEIGSADGFINLAGVSINDGRWTLEHQKQDLRQSDDSNRGVNKNNRGIT